jgi:hypothetical protein
VVLKIVSRGSLIPHRARRGPGPPLRKEAVPILVAERSRLVHLFGANTPRAWPNFGDNHADGEPQCVNDPWRV